MNLRHRLAKLERELGGTGTPEQFPEQFTCIEDFYAHFASLPAEERQRLEEETRIELKKLGWLA